MTWLHSANLMQMVHVAKPLCYLKIYGFWFTTSMLFLLFQYFPCFVFRNSFKWNINEISQNILF